MEEETGVKILGWDAATGVWRPVLVGTSGTLQIIDPPPADPEKEKKACLA
jgi:hypothetical protein